MARRREYAELLIEADKRHKRGRESNRSIHASRQVLCRNCVFPEIPLNHELGVFGDREMTKPFFNRLMDYYSEIGKVLRGEANAASIFPNSTDIGLSREKVYAEVLKTHLPSSCNVTFGGFLFDQKGNESKQIDILITNESSLRFNFYNKDGTGKSFACIDGCVGVVTVKSMLDSNQLFDALDNIASIPDLRPLSGDQIIGEVIYPHFDDLPYKIVYASDGIGLQNLTLSLNSFYIDKPAIPFHKRPNLIHVAGRYGIVRSRIHSTAPDGSIAKPGDFVGREDNTDAFGLLTAFSSIQEAALVSKYILYSYREMVINGFQQSTTWHPSA